MGIIGNYFGLLAPKGRKFRHPDIPSLVIEILIPIICALAAFFLHIRLGNPDIIVAGVGVLGGLLFAHAIFVFQLRLSYSEARRRRNESPKQPKMEKTEVPEMITQMFHAVVYSSALSLFITLIVGMASSLGFQEQDKKFGTILSTIIILLIAHLVGCVWHVLTITTSAYRDLQNEM
jgi:sterol desaturase/sphingolipid hydroxylase (fatty acid hydroxylase superfamily)